MTSKLNYALQDINYQKLNLPVFPLLTVLVNIG